MLVKAEPRTITPRNASERTADEQRRPKHCRSRSNDGGPYRGSSGKRGFVRDEGIAVRSAASGFSDCCDSWSGG